MEQKSDVQYRAEKEYKNSREKFSLLLREIISNAIHAVLIRQSKENGFVPRINLEIDFDEENEKCSIVLTDNGEGFTEQNSDYFNALDKRNEEKERFKFHPLGQGRLAIVYFTDFAEYETVYKDKNGILKKRKISYPPIIDNANALFTVDLFSDEDAHEDDSYTKLMLEISRSQSFSRAKTFFKKHSDVSTLKQWFVETFFPFIVNNENLEIRISFNGNSENINRSDIESESDVISFNITLFEETIEKKAEFKLWLIKKEEKMHGENPVTCFARNLRAELSNRKLSYSIDSDDGYHFYLTSDYFDEQVDTKGERIDISEVEISLINSKIDEILDEKFKTVINKNREETRQNLKKFRKQYPSLEAFVEDTALIQGKNIVRADEIIKTAIEEKSKIEKKFWTQKDDVNATEKAKENFTDSPECEKLLNSSLQIYVKHRERVLKHLHSLIQTFDEEGNDKPELESTVHELFFKRGTILGDETTNVNHLHNLWILDDKFTIFSSNFKAQSTKQGQKASDIYIWADDPEKTKQILILELKSTTKAHNAGNREEGMIAQVKRYAQDFYQNPKDILNWDIDTNSVQYIGIILARKSDINKELSSNTVSGDFEQVPFLSNSYYKDEKFSIGANNPTARKPIRIELYSFEDIYELAYSRNQVFFKLLKKEFNVEDDNGVD